MRSLADLLDYTTLPADVPSPYFVPLVTPPTPFSIWPAAAPNPAPYVSPTDSLLNPADSTLNNAGKQAPPFPDPGNGGILGPILKNGWRPSQGILSGQVADSPPIYPQGVSSGPNDLSTAANDLSFGGGLHHLPLGTFGAVSGSGSPDTDVASTTPDTKSTIPEPTLGPPRPSFGAQPNASAGQRPEPSLFPRIWGRVKDNFSEAYETPLGPGPEFRAFVSPWTTARGTWTDGITWPGRLSSEILLLRVPELIDAAARGTRATYYSAVDALTEQLVFDGVPRDNAELFGRDLKAMPEAFAGAPGTVFPGTPPAPINITRLFSGQWHHAISRVVFRALERHPNLRGYYQYHDPRFVTQAVDLPAHNGWWGWHQDFDKEVERFINEHRDLTPRQFEAYLRLRYDEPDMRVRFPNGLWKANGGRR